MYVALVIGTFALGVALTGWLFAYGMRRLMVVEHPSRYGFDETFERVQRVRYNRVGRVGLAHRLVGFRPVSHQTQ